MVGNDLQQKKKLSHLWSIVEKLPNNDHETSLTIILLQQGAQSVTSFNQ